MEVAGRATAVRLSRQPMQKGLEIGTEMNVGPADEQQQRRGQDQGLDGRMQGREIEQIEQHGAAQARERRKGDAGSDP